ncbi:MAG TPA: D-Ala-D-Ala carboxypeptidase family metallohydrolase [Hyphomicrobiaceae bacterium]|nr:D-Ala-D-Ala carboxypeptidase family metallohydrolase [Hyphomicrobiaceae bacterium]
MGLSFSWRVKRSIELESSFEDRCSSRLVGMGLIAAVFAAVVFSPIAAHAENDGAWAQGGIFYKFRKKHRPLSKMKPRVQTTNLGGVDVDHDDVARPRRRSGGKAYSKRSRSSRRAGSTRRVTSSSRNRSRRGRRVRVASLGGSFASAPTERRTSRSRSITQSRGVSWVASSGCLNGRLRAAIYTVARTYGHVRVNSTCRSRRKNRRVGGARRSLHLSGNAADIRVSGNIRGAARYLRSVAGGYKHYGGGLFHIDTGVRRSW